MDLNEIIYSILNGGQSRHPGVGGGMPWTVNGSAAPQSAPQMAPQQQLQPTAPEAAPTQAVAPQQASAPAGGGFMDGIGELLGGLIAPQRSAKNKTVGWLRDQGLDEGTATLLASSKPALQSYILQRTKNNGPTEFDQRSAAAQQYGLDVNTPEGRNFILTGKLGGDENKPTADIQNYQFAVQNGYKGDFATWKKDNSGRVNVNLPGAPNIGTIPQGYAAKQSPDGSWTMAPIPGGPADTSVSDASRDQGRATSTDVITGAADKIRTLAKEPGATGLIGAGASYIPNTPAAEVYRQVDVLKSNATVENLNAMRRESKTGGALGNVTEKEGAMLAAKSGALDPKSPYFEQQLDDYERTLLRIVHGHDAGDRIFEQTRKSDGVSGDTPSPNAKAPPQVGETRYGYRFKGGDPSEPSNWEKAQ